MSNFKTEIASSVSGKIRKEYNDECFIRQDHKEIVDLFRRSDEKPFSSYGLELSEFSVKETGALHHGFLKILHLEGERITFSTLKEMLNQSKVGSKAIDDSSLLASEQYEKVGENNAFLTKVIDNPRNLKDEWLVAVCKRTARTEFGGIPEPTSQIIIISKTTQRVSFVRPLFLTNILSMINAELPVDLKVDNDIEFEFEEITTK